MSTDLFAAYLRKLGVDENTLTKTESEQLDAQGYLVKTFVGPVTREQIEQFLETVR